MFKLLSFFCTVEISFHIRHLRIVFLLGHAKTQEEPFMQNIHSEQMNKQKKKDILYDVCPNTTFTSPCQLKCVTTLIKNDLLLTRKKYSRRLSVAINVPR